MNSSRTLSMRRLRLPVLALIALVALTSGCANPVTFEDDIEFDLDIQLRAERDDDLHMPYVRGTDVRIFARGVDDDVRFEVSDASVLSVSSASGGSVSLRAVGAGSAELSVWRGDRELHSATLTVGAPTHAELTPRGEVLLDVDSMAVSETKVLLRERATFRVRYFDGETRLFGNGVIEGAAMHEGAISVEYEVAYGAERGEFLKVRPLEIGVHELALSAAGVDLGVLRIEGVGPEAVARVEILGVPESSRGGRLVELYAVAYDAADGLILGDGFRWFLDEERSFGTGDLFTYEHDRSADPTRLVAVVGDVEGEAFIRASEGTVGTTADIGCSAGGRPSAASAALGLFVLGALVTRRGGRA